MYAEERQQAIADLVTHRGRLSVNPRQPSRVGFGVIAERSALKRRHAACLAMGKAPGLIRFAVFLLLIFVAVWAGVRVAHAGDDGSIYTGTPYTVRAGDDLWTIAGQQYGTDSDPRAGPAPESPTDRNRGLDHERAPA